MAIPQPLDDNSIMAFGKYKGRSLANVPAHYLLWLWENADLRPPLKGYIEANLEVIKKEVEISKRKKDARK